MQSCTITNSNGYRNRLIDEVNADLDSHGNNISNWLPGAGPDSDKGQSRGTVAVNQIQVNALGSPELALDRELDPLIHYPILAFAANLAYWTHIYTSTLRGLFKLELSPDRRVLSELAEESLLMARRRSANLSSISDFNSSMSDSTAGSSKLNTAAALSSIGRTKKTVTFTMENFVAKSDPTTTSDSLTTPPLLIVHSAADPTVPFEASYNLAARRQPFDRCRLVQIDSRYLHNPHLENSSATEAFDTEIHNIAVDWINETLRLDH